MNGGILPHIATPPAIDELLVVPIVALLDEAMSAKLGDDAARPATSRRCGVIGYRLVAGR